MSAIIGIVARDEKVGDTLVQAITKNNMRYLDDICNYIGIVNYNNNNDINTDILDLCDGFIFQGGSMIYDYHFKILEYALLHNKPVLGICMGNQIIGLYSTNLQDEDLVKVSNHYSLTDYHKIKTTDNSLLRKLFGQEIDVNSRHLYKLDSVDKPFKVTAYSDDDVIEGIEYIDEEHFIVGVQWHPEDMDNMHGLYNYFVKEVIKRKGS